MIIYLSNKGYEKSDTHPNNNPYPDNRDVVLLKEFSEDEQGNVLFDQPTTNSRGEILSDLVVNNYPYFDIIHADGTVTDIIPTEPIELEGKQSETSMTEQEIISEIKRLANLL